MGQIVSDMPCCAGQAPDETMETSVPTPPAPSAGVSSTPATQPYSAPAPQARAEPAPAPASGGSSGDAYSQESVVLLTAMGFSEADAKRGLQESGGNVEQAAAMLAAGGGSEDPKVEQIVAMGFTAQQAKDALDGYGGSVERAVDYLMNSS
eukprot:gb/GFBE01010305.1/.p1 GENE.gb/GFBE01010305.1/~~gb/GFBE01010305.1/.p1  ORF type:complete len:151 (+),score=41.27 gb/GFBE01010305.1/:1-453(+)